MTAVTVPQQHSPVAEMAGEDVLVFIAQGTAGTVGEEFFESLVEHLARAFGADVGFVAEVMPEDRQCARFLACWEGGKQARQPLEYELAGTPCAEVADSEVVFYSQGVRARFPEDEMVQVLGLDSYLAVGLRGSDGAHLGQLGVLAAAPLAPDDRRVAVLQIFAARAAAEVERRHRERALRESEAAQRALAEEQAALRRVATLAAADAPTQELLDAVASEVGRLIGADITTLVRLQGEQLEILSAWSDSPAVSVPVGMVVHLDQATVTKDAVLTGRPARIDDLVSEPDGPAKVVRDLGIRSALATPIKVSGSTWGAVTAARTRTEPFPSAAERRLGDFAELVAQAIANCRAQEELAASRVRIVEAGDEARRRIERDLHDGAQQRFLAATVALRLARARVADGKDDSIELLDQVHDELLLALDELRKLAQGIHPAVLTERGLGAAIAAVARRSSVPVTVVEVPSQRLPAAVEVAGYYVVAEALTNVAKYADASSATVRAVASDDVLVVEVSDDGVGGADAEQGSGIRGLIDRLDVLGGGLQVDSPPGLGPTLVATIPVT
jgi:signal transduction histidine kinase